MLGRLNEDQRQLILTGLPALVASLLAWTAFIGVGQTPLLRATGLALAVMGMTMALRRMGAALAITGGLALAFSPTFWSQTGGGASIGPATTVVALVAAVIAAGAFVYIRRHPYIALGIGVVVFAVIFWSQIGTPRSLRLTGLLTTWTLFLLVDALLKSNPRPEEAPPVPIEAQHSLGLLILLFVGVLNDPLFVLLAPAVIIGLWLSWTPLPTWFWVALAVVVVIGIRGVLVTYIDPTWWRFSADEALRQNLQFPYITADGWRSGARWVDLLELIMRQFTPIGAVLSIFGLARLARWYPVLGVVSMIAYGSYTLFGLVYFGADREILLLPMSIIQVIWLTYAVYSFSHWLQKTLDSSEYRARALASGVYVLLPLYLFLFVSGIV
ncbi:MAG: hypothetical protein SF029_21360 [bacterium]|nr:hypothetical protein [bacterium]